MLICLLCRGNKGHKIETNQSHRVVEMPVYVMYISNRNNFLPCKQQIDSVNIYHLLVLIFPQ